MLVVDNFAGGGGASLGIEQALGRSPDIAINHDPEAVAMHRANHPDTRHLCQSVWKANPYDVAAGRTVDLAWFSPDCRHHSKAKGGKPREKNIRDLAWVVVAWAKTVRPRVIMLENVEEFRDWGPLLDDGRPCPDRRGLTFRRWVNELKRCGYKVEWRELRACDFGAPTIRKRLFLVARCDGHPIVWPEPTHGPDASEPYRTAADVIDWNQPTYSIFMTKEEVREIFRQTGVRVNRPLADATMARIARGVWKYVINAADPFIISVAHGYSGGRREYPADEPLGTISAGGVQHAVVAPSLVGVGGRMGQSDARSVDAPYHTTTTKADTALVAPTLIQTGYGERLGQAPRSLDLHEPLGTVVAGGAKHALVSAFLAQHNGGPRNSNLSGRDVRKPVSTIVQTGSTQALVAAHVVNFKGESRSSRSAEEPVSTICAGGQHVAEVRAFLVKYYGSGGQLARCDDPMHTLTAKARLGLVTVHGVDYQIADIGMRMLTPRELFRAQGFPDTYVVAPEVNGKPLTKTAQIRMCGNSVCPPMAEALVRANFETSKSAEGKAA